MSSAFPEVNVMARPFLQLLRLLRGILNRLSPLSLFSALMRYVRQTQVEAKDIINDEGKYSFCNC